MNQPKHNREIDNHREPDDNTESRCKKQEPFKVEIDYSNSDYVDPYVLGRVYLRILSLAPYDPEAQEISE